MFKVIGLGRSQSAQSSDARQGKASGFTLIELLVVIAIIALLAAILFPVFARARENARKSSCANNFKQIGLGLAQYVQDFDESYPYSRCNGYPGAGANWVPWHVMVQPYIKSVQAFKCPSNTQTTGLNNSSSTTAPTLPGGIGYPKSYVANGTRTNGPMWDAGSRNLADIGKPAQVILVVELNNRADPEYWGGDPTAGSYWFQAHLNQTNMLFCDGHVKSMKAVPTSTPVNMWAYDNGALTSYLVTDIPKLEAKLEQ